MQSKSSAKDVIIGFIILICLLVYAVAAVVAVFKVFGWLMERSAALCLSIHGVVAASGLLLWLLPDGWWLWIAGAPLAAWAVVVGVVALPVFWNMITSWISSVTRQFGLGN